MASSPSNSTSEPAVMEKVLKDFFAKSVHIILESRSPCVSSRNHNAEPSIPCPSSSSSMSIRRRDKRFDLAVLENFDLLQQSNLEPLIVDIVLDRRKAVPDVSCGSPCGIFVRNLSSERNEFGRRNRSEKIVERWIVQFESESISKLGRECSFRGSKKDNKAYRRIIVLLRSLYTVVRLLPAYKLSRDLNALGQIHPFTLSHRVSSIAEPFSREEDAEMSQHEFGPLDIFFGRLSISVAYLRTLEDVSSGPSTPTSTEFIMDYVGSPLVHPLKRLPSLPAAGSAPSYASYLPENSSSPCSVAHVSFAGHANDFNECRPSPSSSSSSSPTHLCRAFSNSESASCSIPLHRQKGSDGGQNQCLSPSPYYKSKRQGCPSQVDSLGTQENTPSAPITFSLENTLKLKRQSLRLMEFQTGMVLPKIVSAGNDSAGHLTRLKTPYSPPQIPSRSSSRLFFMDEFDDSDFICPFAEDDEVTNSFRVESANSKGHDAENLCPGQQLMPIRRSLDAAVGELVWMLRSAPPLRPYNSSTLRSIQVFKDKVSSQKTQLEKIENKDDELKKVDSILCLEVKASDLFKLRTAADAFKELETYKDIRELILKHGGSPV